MTDDNFDKWVEGGCPDDTAQIETVLADLANLDLISYDQKREAIAKEHKIRVSTLDAEVQKRRPRDLVGDGDTDAFEDVEPWDEPVNGAELLGHLVKTVERFCILPEHAAVLIASWTVHAWAHDVADTLEVGCQLFDHVCRHGVAAHEVSILRADFLRRFAECVGGVVWRHEHVVVSVKWIVVIRRCWCTAVPRRSVVCH